jgi:aminopeptidase N
MRSIFQFTILLTIIGTVILVPIEKEELSYRLPNDTIPIRYEIYISTEIHNGEDFGFDGSVKIQLKVVEETEQITIHSRFLDIKKVSLRKSDGGAEIAGIKYDLKKEVDFLIVKSPEKLIVDQQYILEIDYNGTLRTDSSGFYRSSYKNEENNTVFLATTQFEQTDARHGFPCYDEPGIRAEFGLTIRHHKSYNAVSNMPVQEATQDGDYFKTKFQDTPRMQAFILAFVISDFEYIANETSRPPQKVYARPVSIKKGEVKYALETGIKVIATLEDELKVEYNQPKLDQIGIPDYIWGAMENWGGFACRIDDFTFQLSYLYFKVW